MPNFDIEPARPQVIDLELEMKREELFIKDYARILTGKLTSSDFDQIMIKYRFKTWKEAKNWTKP